MQDKPLSHTQQLLAGSLSGLVSCLMLQPLDVLKTRLQQPDSTINVSSLERTRWLLRTLPLTTWWRGTVPTIVRNVPGTAIYFYTLSAVRQTVQVLHWSPQNSKSHTLSNMLIGGFSRSFVGFIMMPFTVIKTRIESSKYAYSSMAHAAAALWQEQGIRGLFRGTIPTMMRDAPFAGIYVASYEHLRHLLSPSTISPSLITNITAGFMAGAVATSVTHPLDLLKTRVQLSSQKMAWWETCREMTVKEGWQTWTRGMVPRLLRKSLSSAVTWALYEECVRVVQRMEVAAVLKV